MLNWLFDKKKNEKVNLSHIGIDLHSHIIPGIDDGVETVQESVMMAQKMQELGYSRMVTTPHVMWDCYKNTPEIILAGLEDVRHEVKKLASPFRLMQRQNILSTSILSVCLLMKNSF